MPLPAAAGALPDHSGRTPTTTVSVPTDALVMLEGDTVVFRRNAAGALEPAPVRTGEAIGDRTVIREGLKPGDAVVVEGAFAASVAARLGGDHGIDLPITRAVADIIDGQLDVMTAMQQLMNRPITTE